MSNEHITLHTQALTAHPAFVSFWEATKRQKLMLPRCASCGETHWYPRSFCPFCFSTELKWVEASGHAKLYAATALTKASDPYIVAYVELAEGPLMLTNIVGTALSDLKIGAPLAVDFTILESGHYLPVFKLVA